MSNEEVLRLGKADPGHPGGEFSMPVLAIRMADRYNGVSELHGREARAMWRGLWPRLDEHEVPIGSITNGVHLGTWVAGDLAAVYRRVLGPDWQERGDDAALWARIAGPPRRRAVGPAPERARPPGAGAAGPHARAHRAQGPGVRPRQAPRSARSQRAHARLRAPLRHLQARHAAAPRRGAPAPHPLAGRAPGAARLRRQGAPPGHGRQGAHPRHRPRLAQRRLPRAGRLHRGLRHERGAGPRAPASTCG